MTRGQPCLDLHGEYSTNPQSTGRLVGLGRPEILLGIQACVENNCPRVHFASR
jgi:hypothetical protein